MSSGVEWSLEEKKKQKKSSFLQRTFVPSMFLVEKGGGSKVGNYHLQSKKRVSTYNHAIGIKRNLKTN
jgi:hypothetical protein